LSTYSTEKGKRKKRKAYDVVYVTSNTAHKGQRRRGKRKKARAEEARKKREGKKKER